MSDLKLGFVESKFADLIWQHKPVASGQLVKICEEELCWKKPTTYNVLRKLCDKGIFQNDHGVVSSLISRSDFYAMQGEVLLNEAFQGSLPAFIAAFTKRNTLTAQEAEEIRKMIDSFEE